MTVRQVFIWIGSASVGVAALVAWVFALHVAQPHAGVVTIERYAADHQTMQLVLENLRADVRELRGDIKTLLERDP